MTRLQRMFRERRLIRMFLFDCFLMFSESSIAFPFGLPDVEFVAIFARNGITPRA